MDTKQWIAVKKTWSFYTATLAFSLFLFTSCAGFPALKPADLVKITAEVVAKDQLKKAGEFRKTRDAFVYPTGIYMEKRPLFPVKKIELNDGKKFLYGTLAITGLILGAAVGYVSTSGYSDSWRILGTAGGATAGFLLFNVPYFIDFFGQQLKE